MTTYVLSRGELWTCQKDSYKIYLSCGYPDIVLTLNYKKPLAINHFFSFIGL